MSSFGQLGNFFIWNFLTLPPHTHILKRSGYSIWFNGIPTLDDYLMPNSVYIIIVYTILLLHILYTIFHIFLYILYYIIIIVLLLLLLYILYK